MRRRSISLVAGLAVAGAVLAGTSASADPITDLTKTVEHTVRVNVPPADTGPVVGGGVGGGVGRGGGRSAVVGYISVVWLRSQGQPTPTYTLSGALAVPETWRCSSADAGSSFSVTCVPASTAVELTWHCDVLHADVSTSSAEAAARTSLDCDSDGAPEAQTATATGIGGHDSKWSVDTRIVSAFTCTIDNPNGSATPDYIAGCGDPGLVGLE